MASRRRRRKSIGKVIVDVERRVRRVEKRPGAKRLKTNVVTTEKLGFRAVTTKVIQEDAVTANEAAFGVTVVSGTDPAIVKEGTTVVDPGTGGQKVYSEVTSTFVDVTDPTAQAAADSKSATFYQDNQPAGTAYEVGDMWVDTNDDNKLYTWSGSSWVLTQDSAAAYDAALASLQPSANTIVNASNQITAVNTNGITVYSGSSPTTGARIVMNSAGLAGFNSSSTGAGNGATFSISASTGDAIFSGTVNATGGTFTGYVTAGTARFGAAVQTGKNGIYINSTNYWYDDGSFTAGTGTSTITYDGSGTLTIGAGSSIGGTTASTVVSGAADGATALQEGNGVLKNGSDQITTISTASGIVVGTAPTAAGNTARVVINSGGFFAYDGTGETVGITSAGVARFKGAVTGSTFTSTNYTGGTGLALAPTGTGNAILFNVSAVPVASIAAVVGGMVLTSGSATLSLASAGSVQLTSINNALLMSAAPTFLSGSGSNTGGGLGSIRNTWASAGDPSGGDLGDVWLKWA